MKRRPDATPNSPDATRGPARTALEGMSEAERPTGPLLAIIVSVVFMAIGALPFAPFLNGMSTESFGGQLLMTVSFLGPMLLFFAWVRFKERRSILSLGFRGRPGKHIACGAALALAMTAITVGINVLAGTASLGKVSWGMIPSVLVLLVGFAIQSSTEEIADRGYMLQAVAPRWGLVAAIIVQIVLFAALHGGNGGLTWVAWGNLCGVALFLALWVWRTGSLWGACAFHTIWNWSQGNLWGASVSNQRVHTSVGHYTPNHGSADLITGGGFGLEGSVIPFVIFLVLSAILVATVRRTPVH